MENSGKYYTMFLGLLVLITALTISGIAIYYSVAGLVAIFAAAARAHYDYGRHIGDSKTCYSSVVT